MRVRFRALQVVLCSAVVGCLPSREPDPVTSDRTLSKTLSLGHTGDSSADSPIDTAVDASLEVAAPRQCGSGAPVTGAPVLHGPPFRTPWQMHRAGGVVLFGFVAPVAGDTTEFNLAIIPAAGDPAWSSAPNPNTIAYNGAPSALCGTTACRSGGDFTYFQTFFSLPPDIGTADIKLSLNLVNDGVRTTIFNSVYPTGITVPWDSGYTTSGGYPKISSLLKAGEINRIVVTHVDDCCRETYLKYGQLFVNYVPVPLAGAGSGGSVDDSNPCTVDSCDQAGNAVHLPVGNGARCADETVCNGDETCRDGACTAGTPLEIDDKNGCTVDGCHPVEGITHTPAPADTPCDDGDPCNGTEKCNGMGACQRGPAPPLDDGNPCTLDSCGPDGIRHDPLPNGSSCADANACDGTETCQAGVCTPDSPPPVDDGNPCTADSCDPRLGVRHVPIGDGGSCDDGNQCTLTDVCVQGVCEGRDLVQCFPKDVCHIPGVCAPDSGLCSDPERASCEDLLPPDPAAIAPPVDRTIPTHFPSAYAFLFRGTPSVQQEVAPDAIDPLRMAILRGRVLHPDGSPLAGVKVTIAGQPQLGHTATRQDGVFDLVVNGGGLLTVRYRLDHYPPVDRQVEPPWQDFAWLPDVVLTPLDRRVTTIFFGGPMAMQVARGSTVSDVDGPRNPALLIPAGTQATLHLPDGTQQPASQLAIRTTEYTVGSTGPRAMPAPLPASSGYTYAIELSADQGIAADATRIEFDRPVIHYVENFLEFPVGGPVPVGYYDKDKGAWIPSENGRVVRILSLLDGMASIDIDGTGVAASDAELAALGVSTDERARLAALYAVGTGLWRVPMTHFTPWDCNWPYGPPDDAEAPDSEVEEDEEDEDCDEDCGSIIQARNRSLGERVAIEGTPFSLNYRSSRTAGRTTRRRLTLRLKGQSVPASLREIKWTLSVAGQQFRGAAGPGAGAVASVLWDGNDAYGRKTQGRQPLSAQVAYGYTLRYLAPADFDRAFARVGQATFISDRTSMNVDLARDHKATAGAWEASPLGFGTWSLDAQHAYSARGQILYQGDGYQRSAAGNPSRVATSAAAGNGDICGWWSDPGCGSGGPARDASLQLENLSGLLAGADGTFFIAETGGHWIRKVSREGTITRYAGSGVEGYSGDGGPAVDASLSAPGGLASSPDGSLYVADTKNHRIRRIAPDGTITTVAGTDVHGGGGDGAPALSTALTAPAGVAVGRDGSVYIADTGQHRILKVDRLGVVEHLAGSGAAGFAGDNGAAKTAALNAPSDVAVGTDGTVFVLDGGNLRVRKVTPDGRIVSVAGNGNPCASSDADCGDGGQGSAASLSKPSGIGLDPLNAVYITDKDTGRVRRVSTGGVIQTIIRGRHLGAGNACCAEGATEDSTANQAIKRPGDVALSPAGGLLVADRCANQVHSVRPPFPTLSHGDALIASADGREVYAFDAQGRHTSTRYALTGAVSATLTYDDSGRLTGIGDGDGKLTRIIRGPAGNATTIIAPHGQETRLLYNSVGQLARIVDPAGASHRMDYTGLGLLTELRDKRDQVHPRTYDAEGQLVTDENPAGGSWTLSRTRDGNVTLDVLQSAMGRIKKQMVADLRTGARRRTNVDPSGFSVVRETESSGLETTTAPDGTITRSIARQDPRWGLMAPLVSTEIRTPSGLTSVTTHDRDVGVQDSDNPLSLIEVYDRTSVNGRVSQRFFDVATRNRLTLTPEFRPMTEVVDAQERVIRREVPGLAPVEFTYDAQGRLLSRAQGTRVTVNTYDNSGFLSSTRDPLDRVVEFTRDANGRVLVQRLPGGREVAFTYDTAGNTTSVTPPGRPAHGFDYTPVELMSRYVPPDVGIGPTATQYAYNADKQITSITRPDALVTTFNYDSGGRLSSLVSPAPSSGGTESIAYGYDSQTGKLTSMTTSAGVTTSYTYDGPLVTSETWSGAVNGSIEWQYDEDFRVISERVNGTAPVAFAYDQDGLLIQAGEMHFHHDPQNGLLRGTNLGVVADTWTYNDHGEPLTYEARAGDVTIYRYELQRDPLGRIVQKTEQVLDGPTEVFEYGYDLAGRLAQVKKDQAIISSYAYDSNGNRIGAQVSFPFPLSVAATYDNQDRLLSYGASIYAYTRNGDLLAAVGPEGATRYRYDVRGNLRQVELPSGPTVTFLVDARDRRVGVHLNGKLDRTFLWSSSLRVAAELDGSAGSMSRFVYGERANVPEYAITSGVANRILTDHLGSPRLVVDSETGAVRRRVDFDVFGAPTSDSNPGLYPFGFSGGLGDAHISLVRLGRRDLDVKVGRWTARDPSGFGGGDSNLFAYVANDPVNYLDPWGLTSSVVLNVAGGMLPFPPFDLPFVHPQVEDRASSKAKWFCTAQCNVQVIKPKPGSSPPSRVSGSASGPSEEEACREAKRQATQSAPAGCYARHCKCDCTEK